MEETSASVPDTPTHPENTKDALRKKLKAKQQQRAQGSTPLPAGIQSQGLTDMFSMVDKMMKENPELMKDMESKVKQMVSGSNMMPKMEESIKKMSENGELESLAAQMASSSSNTKKKKYPLKKKKKPKKPPTVFQEQATSTNLE